MEACSSISKVIVTTVCSISLSSPLCDDRGCAIAMLFINEKKRRNRIKEMNSLKHSTEDTPADYNFYGACFHFPRD
jgi:hypothetical protein